MTTESEQRVLNHLRRIIHLGHYPEGSRLPTERELAAELAIGRGPIRRALAALEAEGQISRHVGQGTFVGSRPAVAHPQPTGPFMNPASPADIMETRLIIEPRLAAMAAARASEEDISYLRLCTTKSEAAETWTAWDRWDATFHRTIALAAHNTMLADFIELINKARRNPYGSRARRAAKGSEWRATLIRQHRDIVDALASRDPQGAAMAMRHHLTYIEEQFFGDPDGMSGITEGL